MNPLLFLQLVFTTDIVLIGWCIESTRDNTSANTGGASGPPRSGSGEKEGFMDKVKDKLNIGNKD